MSYYVRNQIHVQLERDGRLRTSLTDSTDPDGNYKGHTTDTDPSTTNLDDGEWHMYTLTTRTDGQKGFSVYIDGVTAATMPEWEDGIASTDNPNGGGPFDPDSPMLFCGHQKGSRTDGERDLYRYFLGELAHFSVISSALDTTQIAELQQEYKRAFNFHCPECEATTVAPDNTLNSLNLDSAAFALLGLAWLTL
jgi:hypothetical protein